MKKLLIVAAAISLVGIAGSAEAIDWWSLGNTKVGPEQTLKDFHQYFKEQFPKMSLQKYALGSYAFSPEMYQQYQQAIQFNPGDLTLSQGKAAWQKKFPDGKTYASCFKDGGKGVAASYPFFNNKTGQVVTTQMRLNSCRVENHLQPLKYGSGSMIALDTYFTSLSNGMPVDIKVQGPGAVKAFEEGRQITS
jgi:Cytochrome c